MTVSALKMIPRAGLLALLITVGACSNMNTTQQRTLSGAGIGAAGGAAVGAIAGGSVAGAAALGAAGGAAAGYIYDQSQK